MTGPYRVTLCALNSRYTHTALAPRYLRAAIARRFSSCEVACSFVEGTVNEPLSNVLSRITEDEPQLLGLSCYIWNVTQMLFLASAYKAVCPSGLLVLGGPEASYRQEELLRENPCVDFILSGEGETTLPALIQALRSGTPLSEVPSLSYREKDGEIMISTPYVGGGDPISPYADEDLSSLGGRIAYLEASRGCPYQCTFCLSGRCGNVRYFDPVQVKTDVLHLASCGVRVIKFVDRTFNADPRRAIAIWQALRDERYTKTYHFEICAGLLDEQGFAALAALPAGKVQLEIGLQSTNPQTLAAVSRHIDADAVLRAARRLTDMGNMHVHLDLIAGLPYESYDRFAESFDAAYACCHLLQLGFLKLLRGTPLRRDADRYGIRYLQQPPYTVLQTSWMSYRELCLLSDMDAVLGRYRDGGRFVHCLDLVLGILPSPFRFYEALAKHIEQVYARPVDKLSQPDAFRAFLDCAVACGVDRAALLPLLRLDFEACEHRAPPHWMYD